MCRSTYASLVGEAHDVSCPSLSYQVITNWNGRPLATASTGQGLVVDQGQSTRTWLEGTPSSFMCHQLNCTTNHHASHAGSWSITFARCRLNHCGGCQRGLNCASKSTALSSVLSVELVGCILLYVFGIHPPEVSSSDFCRSVSLCLTLSGRGEGVVLLADQSVMGDRRHNRGVPIRKRPPKDDSGNQFVASLVHLANKHEEDESSDEEVVDLYGTDPARRIRTVPTQSLQQRRLS